MQLLSWSATYFRRNCQSRDCHRLFPTQVRDGLRDAWPAFLDGLAALRQSRSLLKAFSLHLTEWLMRATTLWLFGISFALGVPASTFLVLTVALSVFTLFPVTFMNIGTYQVVAIEVLHAAGAPRSEAFAYAVTAQALSYLWVALMGLTALWSLQLWPRQVAATVRQATDTPDTGGPRTNTRGV
ncbi:MAG: hypothetical protein GEU75_13115 [Dehalococcoidia bacterium]|nr:hypothetical protein [Dehalococcoidia bacterium]